MDLDKQFSGREIAQGTFFNFTNEAPVTAFIDNQRLETIRVSNNPSNI